MSAFTNLSYTQWVSEWVSEWVKSLSRVRLFATPWIVAHKAPLSMGFSRQEYWSGLPFPSPGESSQPRDRTQVSRIAGRRFNLWATRKVLYTIHFHTHKKITCFINTVLQIFSLVSKKPLKFSLKVSFCKVSWCFLWLPCFAQTKQRYFMTHSYSSCFLISYPLIFSSL